MRRWSRAACVLPMLSWASKPSLVLSCALAMLATLVIASVSAEGKSPPPTRPAPVMSAAASAAPLVPSCLPQAPKQPLVALAELNDKGLTIADVTVPGGQLWSPKKLGKLAVHEFLLTATAANNLSIGPNPNDPSGWWLDPSSGLPTKDGFETSISIEGKSIEDCDWIAQLGTNVITVKFPAVVSTACVTMDVTCPTKQGGGDVSPAPAPAKPPIASTRSPSIACSDWSSLQTDQKTSLLKSTLFVPIAPLVPSSLRSAKPDTLGNFGGTTNGLCDAGLPLALSRGPVRAFVFIPNAGGSGPGVQVVTLQAATPPKGVIDASCKLPEGGPSKQLAADVTTAQEAAKDTAGYPVLIVSYVNIISKGSASWSSDCDDKSPVREKVEDGHINEPAICILGSRRNRNDTTLGHPYFPSGAALRIWVIHPESVDASVSASQAQGLTSVQVLPGNGAISLPSGAQSTASAGSLTSPSALRAPPRTSVDHECILDRYELAPRPTGPFTVVSQLLDNSGAIVPGSIRSLEMLVDQLYMGAVRVGLALSFPTYGVRAFGIHQAGNGATEIFQDSFSPVALEVIAGYTQFWKQRYASEVRCNILPCLAPSPFVGVGVISGASSNTFNVLTSVYIGGEWEIGPFTLQILPLGLRRDTVLASGFSVGSAVPATTTSVPTATVLHWAPAVSLTVDGDILKIAGVGVP